MNAFFQEKNAKSVLPTRFYLFFFLFLVSLFFLFFIFFCAVIASTFSFLPCHCLQYVCAIEKSAYVRGQFYYKPYTITIFF
jgi:hypothetical protein